MASELIVQTLKGPTSGANANKIIVPSGQTLDASSATIVPSAGQVVQTEHFVTTTQTTNTSSGVWVDVNMSLSITPTSASNKILVTYSSQNLANNTDYVAVRLLRGSTEINKNTGYNNTVYWHSVHGGIVHLDNPATTSSVTYKIQCYISSAAGDLRHNYLGNSTGYASLTLMEIAQ